MAGRPSMAAQAAMGNRPSKGRPAPPGRFVPRPFGHRPFFRPFVPFGVVVYGGPGFYGPSGYWPNDYGAPPSYYSGPPDYGAPSYDSSLSPAVPDGSLSQPSGVVEFPTGRYVLQGDGVNAPYVWVWIPNPPPGPPPLPPPPPTAPPGAPSSDPGGPYAPQRSIYQWTDEQGVIHLTDRPDTIPLQYRRPPVAGAAATSS